MPTTARVARIHEYGPPEVLRFEDIVVGEPGDDEALIRNTVIGLTSSPFGVLTPMSQPDSLHLTQCNLVLCPVVKFGCSRRFMADLR